MHKQFTLIIFILSALTLSFAAQAAIYKHVDANGNVTYSNVKIKGGKKLALEPADTSFGTKNNDSDEMPRSKGATSKATPSNFPKVDADTQKQRDNSRKEILLSELQSERIALEDAKIAYDEGKSNPEVFRRKNADGTSRTFRNVPKFQEKMKRLQETVDAHQRNIELLEKEIASI